MTCEEALLAISAALDGELPPVERARLSEHLMQCGSCRELAEDLRVLTGALEDSDREPPAGLSESVRKAVAEEPQAVPVPKKRRPPYLRSLAALLALCIGLGGIGLFVSGQGGGNTGSAAGSAAPALYQAAPRAMEKSAGCDGLDDCDGAVGYSAAEGSGPAEAPMEESDAEVPQPAPADAPMPSIAPAPQEAGTYNFGATQEENAPDGGSEGGDPTYNGGGPTSDSAGSGSDRMEGEEKLSLTPEEALELVFEHLGGYEEYPEARQRVVCMYGFDAPAYYLKTVETDMVSAEYCLDYAGPPPEGEGYCFRFYEMVTDKQEDGFDHTATSNWYIVSPDGEITAEFPE